MGLFDNINASGIASLGGMNPASSAPDSMGIQTEPYSAIAPAVAPTVTRIEDLYQQVLGRAPDAEGYKYWTDTYGTGPVTADVISAFKSGAAAELANTGYTPTAPVTTPANFSSNAYFAANPDVATAYQANPFGLNADQYAQSHYSNYGAKEQRLADPNAIYEKIVQDSYGTIGRTGIGADASNIDQPGLDYWKGELAAGRINPQDFGNVFNNAVKVYKEQNPDDKYTQYVNNYQKTQTENSQIKDYVSSVLSDTSLTPSEQANKILNQARQGGFDQQRLESVFGKDKVQPYMDTYKSNINNFINTTLAKEPGTTMNEVGILHKAAVDNKWTPDELVKYGGLDKATAQSYFDLYDKGLGNIVTGLLDPKTDDITKTKTALALAQQYGTTDAELAKASNGKLTEKDLKAYLDPVRNLVPNLQKMMTDNSYTAADVKKLIDSSKADPRAMGIYGSALNQVEQNLPAFLLRDAQNGNGSLAENYQNFLTQAKSTPEMAAKYAPQIAQVEKMLGTTTFTANENFGGKPQDYQLQIVSPLTAKAKADIPQILEFKPIKLETRDDGEGGTYQVQTGGGVKTKGVSGDSEEGYRSTEPITVNGLPVYATYDTQGKLTGYEADSRYRSWLNGKQSISGSFDANGQPKVQSHQSKGAGIRGFTQDIMSDPIMGSLASIAAATFGGPAGLAALQAVQGRSLEDIAKSAALSYVGGQIGQGVTGATASNLGAFGSQAAGQFAGNVGAGLLSGQGVDINNALLNSVVNTGVNTGINSLLGPVNTNTLGSMRPYGTGIASNVISSALAGKDPNIQNAIMKTAMQQAMQSGKTAAKVP